MTHKIAILPGDGIGPEIVAEAVKVIEFLKENAGFDVAMTEAPIGVVSHYLMKP